MGDNGDEHDRRTARKGYTRADWRADGYRRPPPWRRGFQPMYMGITLALVVLLLVVFLVAGSRLR